MTCDPHDKGKKSIKLKSKFDILLSSQYQQTYEAHGQNKSEKLDS